MANRSLSRKSLRTSIKKGEVVISSPIATEVPQIQTISIDVGPDPQQREAVRKHEDKPSLTTSTGVSSAVPNPSKSQQTIFRYHESSTGDNTNNRTRVLHSHNSSPILQRQPPPHPIPGNTNREETFQKTTATLHTYTTIDDMLPRPTTPSDTRQSTSHHHTLPRAKPSRAITDSNIRPVQPSLPSDIRPIQSSLPGDTPTGLKKTTNQDHIYEDIKDVQLPTGVDSSRIEGCSSMQQTRGNTALTVTAQQGGNTILSHQGNNEIESDGMDSKLSSPVPSQQPSTTEHNYSEISEFVQSTSIPTSTPVLTPNKPTIPSESNRLKPQSMRQAPPPPNKKTPPTKKPEIPPKSARTASIMEHQKSKPLAQPSATPSLPPKPLLTSTKPLPSITHTPTTSKPSPSITHSSSTSNTMHTKPPIPSKSSHLLLSVSQNEKGTKSNRRLSDISPTRDKPTKPVSQAMSSTELHNITHSSIKPSSSPPPLPLRNPSTVVTTSLKQHHHPHQHQTEPNTIKQVNTLQQASGSMKNKSVRRKPPVPPRESSIPSKETTVQSRELPLPPRELPLPPREPPPPPLPPKESPILPNPPKESFVLPREQSQSEYMTLGELDKASDYVDIHAELKKHRRPPPPRPLAAPPIPPPQQALSTYAEIGSMDKPSVYTELNIIGTKTQEKKPNIKKPDLPPPLKNRSSSSNSSKETTDEEQGIQIKSDLDSSPPIYMKLQKKMSLHLDVPPLPNATPSSTSKKPSLNATLL